MRLEFAILADDAQVAEDGKLNIKGGDWDTVYAPGFPARRNGAFALVVRLILKPEEAADSGTSHIVRVDVIQPGGAPLFPPLRAEFRPIIRQPLSDRPAKHTLVFSFPIFLFPLEGRYEFRLFVDDAQVGSAPLYAVAQQSLTTPLPA